MVKNPPAMQKTQAMVWLPGLGRFPGEGNDYSLSILAWRISWTEEPGRLQSMGSQRVGHNWVIFTLGFPDRSVGKEYACNVRDLGSIPGLGRSSREGKGYPLQYAGLENSIVFIVHGVAKSQTQLSNFHFHSFFYQLYKMVTLLVNTEVQ